MSSTSFNPVNFAINLVIGWFFMSFLQAVFLSFFAGKWDALMTRFRAIAFFHDDRATVINIAIILTIGIVTNVLWYRAHHR